MSNSIAKNGTYLTISKVIVLVNTIICAMLLSRFRTLREYGTYSQILLVTNLVVSIFGMGLPGSINFFVHGSTKIDDKKFISVYFSVSTFICIVVDTLLFACTPFISKSFNNLDINTYAYVFLLFPWTKVMAQTIDNIMIVYNKVRILVIYKIVFSVLSVGIVLVCCFFNFSFYEYMFMFIILESISAISVYVLSWRNCCNFNFSFDWIIIKDVLCYSIPLGLSTMTSMINTELGKLVMSLFLTPEEVAIYSNASREMPLNLIPYSMATVVMPVIVSKLKVNKVDDSIKIWGKTTLFSYIFISFGSMVLFVFAREIMTILYSEKYLSGVSIFRVFALMLLLRATLFTTITNAAGKTKYSFYSLIIALISNIVLIYPLYVLCGLLGPAIAMFFSVIIMDLFLLILTCKTLNVKFKCIMPWKDLLNITILNILLMIIFNFLNMIIRKLNVYSKFYLHQLILLVLWSVIYIIILRKKTFGLWKEKIMKNLLTFLNLNNMKFFLLKKHHGFLL